MLKCVILLLALLVLSLTYFMLHKSTASADFSGVIGEEKSLLQKQREYQEFFCADVHPIVLKETISSHDVGVLKYGNVGRETVRMALFDRDDIVSTAIMGSGWEMNEIKGIARKMEAAKASGVPDPIFLDIGSNVGWFSVNMAVRGMSCTKI